MLKGKTLSGGYSNVSDSNNKEDVDIHKDSISSAQILNQVNNKKNGNTSETNSNNSRGTVIMVDYCLLIIRYSLMV